MAGQFAPFRSRLKRYFVAYGGWRAVFGSPLFLFSCAVTGLSYANWRDDGWSALSQSLIPSILGFSLGTYAILFSLITNRIKRALRAAQNTQGVSALEEINATFFHFILVQVIALIWAFLFRGSALVDFAHFASSRVPSAIAIFESVRIIGSALGFLLLIYSVTLIVAAALAVYRLALITDPGD
jgi:hypothetical protein